MKILFGIDRYGFSIYNHDIIKYFNVSEGKYKVGHLWYCNHMNPNHWVISFNHCGSETSEQVENIRNITRLGNAEDNEDILKKYWNGEIT